MSVKDLSSVADESDRAGRFVRQESRFRRWVSVDGSTGFPPEAGRYHLYVSYACPWAHRTIIVRALKGLQEVVGMSVVDPVRDERGWAFRNGPGHGPDPINGWAFLAEAYHATDADFAGRITVPVLWDRQTSGIVNNESAEIIRMLNDAFGDLGNDLDLYPEPLRAEIDAVNERVYETVNNGVYRCGFARSQEAYDEAIGPLFETLDWLEERLSGRRYLVGDAISEADIRLFTTLVRFDPVYVTHFKCNLRRLADYPALSAYTRDLFQRPGIADTVDLDHIKRHYFLTHGELNRFGIVPPGLEVDYRAPHGRETLTP